MKHANQPLSEIKKMEWEEFVWVYDELMVSMELLKTNKASKGKSK